MGSRKAGDVAEQLRRVVGSLPAGEAREGQVAMAEAVAAVMSAASTGAGHSGPAEPPTLAVAAGTGTGKSLAYLVPSVLSGKKVVVATATKALQDQLAEKDLPLVAAGLGRKIHWAVLKGRSNYVCVQRLKEIEELGRQATLEESLGSSWSSRRGARAGEDVARLLEWAGGTRTGDRVELGFEPVTQAWASVSVTSDECPGAHRCPASADCFAEKAKARAAQADVVVVNLHLLGAHLRSGGVVLPEHDVLIIDEAHEMEDVMAASLGIDVSPGRVRGVAVAARAASGDSAAADDVLASATGFELALGEAVDQRLPRGLGDPVGSAVGLVTQRLVRLESALRAMATGAGSGQSEQVSEAQQKSLRSLLNVERLRVDLESCLDAADDEVVWVSGGEHLRLRSAPLHVSTILGPQLFSEMPVVLTSATLPPGLAGRLGARADRLAELDVGSPFSYQENALLYCAVSLPERRSDGAEAAIHGEIELLVEAAGGRTLALFTSRRAMDRAAEALRPRISWPIHLQGELPKAALLRAFAEEESSCLFATMSFWQGVDVPGPSLSLVVIDRLPFPRPDEPLFAARREAAGTAGFRQVDLPRAATLLAQGAGRLVRTATDRGVVAVLDPRLAKASYSGYLVKALPRMRRTRSREEAVAFLRSLNAPTEAGAARRPAVAQ